MSMVIDPYRFGVAAGIEYVGGKVTLHTGSAVISLTDLTGGLAASPSVGDLIIVSFGGGGAGDQALSVTTAGYIEVAEPYADDTVDANMSVNYKISDGDTSVTLNNSGTESQPVVSGVEVWRGVDPVTPMDVAAVTATGINTGRPNPGAITPSTEGAIVVVVGLGTNFGATLAVFTTTELSNFLSVAGAGSNNSVIGVGSFEWTSGAFDPATFGGGSTGGNSSWVAVTMALRPA
jgi:hypothetical protein